MIKVGFCVAYDWELLEISLPRVYEAVDLICLAVDKDRHSWSCNPYNMDNRAFYEFVNSIDIDNKIDIYEDDFSLRELNARENCNRHRTLLAERMGPGGWHVQIDCDEYFVDFGHFAKQLKRLNSHPTGKEKPLNVLANLVTVYKRLENGYLLVDTNSSCIETAPFATNSPLYERARNNGHFNIYTNSLVLHESWARNEAELRFKIANWGHSAEELNSSLKQESYLKLWCALDEHNFMYAYNLHPAKPDVWPRLRYCGANNIKELIANFGQAETPYSKLWLALRNNRNIARIRHYARKIFLNG